MRRGSGLPATDAPRATHLRRVLAERQGDKLPGEPLPLGLREGGELGGVGVGHQRPSVRLALDVDKRGKLQAPGARMGVLRLEFGWGGVQTAEDAFGDERKGRMQEVRTFIDGLRRNWQRRLERRQGGVVKICRSRKWRGRGEEEEAGTHGLAGSMVHLHLFVLLPLFVFFLLFLLCLLDLESLRRDL